MYTRTTTCSSLPISPNHSDGDAAVTQISGGDVPVSEEGDKRMTWVLKYFHMLVAFFLQIVAGTDV
jgi:hypothetical protein